MHPQAELNGGGQRMFLIIMFQRSTVAEVIAQRRFCVNAELRREAILRSCRRIDRPLPGLTACVISVDAHTYTLPPLPHP